MAESTQADPDWLALRKHHQQELDAWLMKVEATRREQQRRFDAEQATLLTRHSQEERNYWRRLEQKAASTPRQIIARSQPKPSSVPADQAHVRKKNLPDPPRELLQTPSVDASRIHKSKPSGTVTGSKNQRQAGKHQKQRSQQNHQHNANASLEATKQAQLAQQGPPGTQPAAQQKEQVSQEKGVVIDLCSSDDDEMLVEVSKETYEARVVATNVAGSSRPGIPYAKLQLFGQTGQRHSPFPASPSIKQEGPGFTSPLQDKSGLRSPQLLHDSGGNCTSRPYVFPASSDFSSDCPSPAAATDQPHRYPQPGPISAIGTNLGKNETPSGALHSKMPESTVSSKSRALNDKSISSFSQQQPTDKTSHGLGRGRNDTGSLIVRDQLAREDDDKDVHIEDVPLARLDIPATLRRMGWTAPRKTCPDSASADAVTMTSSVSSNNTEKPSLPTPSPSTASVPTTPICEATDLLRKFKKPGLPSPSRHPLYSSVRVTESRASSCTLAQCQASYSTPRQASVASHSPNVSTISRKRRFVDLSDDEQSDYSPSETSVASCKKPGSPLSSLLMKRAPPLQSLCRPRSTQPPPPSASPVSLVDKKTNGFGFRTKGKPAALSTPLTPPRVSNTKVKPRNPITPPQKSNSAQEKALTTPPSKRRAAIRAQSEIQKMNEADEVFHTDDQIYQATVRERRRNQPSATELGARLRSMSITPIPVGARLGAARDTIAYDHLDKSSVTAGIKGNMCTGNTDTTDRALEHRRTSRKHEQNKINGCDEDEDDDSMEDLDTSKFTHVNGIILQAGQEGRLKAMQTEGIKRREL